MFRSHRAVGRAKPPARHFDVAQVLRGVPAVRLSSAGNGASFRAFRQHTRVRLLPALRFGAGETCFSALFPKFVIHRSMAAKGHASANPIIEEALRLTGAGSSMRRAG
jgi:hypothetical protein